MKPLAIFLTLVVLVAWLMQIAHDRRERRERRARELRQKQMDDARTFDRTVPTRSDGGPGYGSSIDRQEHDD
jgi:hypothetical protein